MEVILASVPSSFSLSVFSVSLWQKVPYCNGGVWRMAPSVAEETRAA